jgi:hypothetical protein
MPSVDARAMAKPLTSCRTSRPCRSIAERRSHNHRAAEPLSILENACPGPFSSYSAHGLERLRGSPLAPASLRHRRASLSQRSRSGEPVISTSRLTAPMNPPTASNTCVGQGMKLAHVPSVRRAMAVAPRMGWRCRIASGRGEVQASQPGPDQAHVVIEGQPADEDVSGPGLHGLAHGADVGQDVGMGENHALGIAGASRRVLHEGHVGRQGRASRL